MIVATFFDIKRAFNTVWHVKLPNKLQALGTKCRMYNSCKRSWTPRRMAMKVRDSKVKVSHSAHGSPTG